MRRVATVVSLVITVTVVAVGAASSTGVSPAQLSRAGWDCIVPLPAFTDVHCAPPGALGRLVTGEAEAVSFNVFDTGDPAAEEAEFLGTEIVIRADRFHGQPCPTDPPSRQYTHLLPLLGLDYYACHRYDSGL